MAEVQDIPEVMAPEEEQPTGEQQQPDRVARYYDYLKKAGADVAPTLDSFKQTLSNDSTARQYYGYLREHKYDAPPDYGSFARTLGIAGTPAQPTAPPQPEHQITHTAIQDLRHLNEMSHQPIRSTTTTLDPLSGGSTTSYSQEDIVRNKGYQDRYEKAVTDLSSSWGTDPKTAKQAIQDFPDESDEGKLKNFAVLGKDNPVYYSRLKSANDIRMAIAKNGPEGINDANAFNHLQAADNYEQLQHNIAMQQEIMRKHDLGQAYFEKLKESQAPLINTLDPSLLVQYWNSDDKKLGLSDFQYAGLETEKMFNPGKYQQDVAIVRHNRGLDEAGQGEPVPQGKKGYAYDRGVENVLYALENQGRQNTGKFISQRTAELGPRIDDAAAKYRQWINSTVDPLLQQHFQQEFLNDPLLQEAAKLDDGQQSIDYARTEDQRRFPLNYGDQASRLVKDAMSTTNGWAGVSGKQVLMGAGESSDNTIRFIKNTFVNLLGSEQTKAENAAANIGHQALTELTGYEGSAFSMQQAPLLIGDGLVKSIQATFNDPTLSTEQKNEKATDLIMNHEGEIKINPKAGQQNLTGKAIIYSAANTVGQILGIADQSLLMGGLLGDAAKAQQMANALVPMYASTQNQLYEQALARGDEKPLLSSHLDAAIISLASLINPDIKVVKGMVGAETGIGKLIAGVEESTWKKVLSTNKPLVERMIAGTKATARQLGLANLQYGLIVPSAQYIVHKNVLNEDPNLGDAIKDGLLQTNISMALPALLHGVWGGVNANKVNPMQKYAIAEAGLHPKENIELIDHLVEKGQITPDRADQIKGVIKQAGDILEHTDGVKSDGTPMSETDVANVTYQLLRKKVLEGKLKNAPDPQKPAIEEKIHEINQSVADLHTSEADKHKIELNQLLTDNLDRIRDKIQPMEASVRDAIKRNKPEEVFKEIYNQATETTKFEGKEISTRPQTEETFGKALVEKAFELHEQKSSARPPQEGRQTVETVEKPSEGAVSETAGATQPAASSFLQTTKYQSDALHERSTTEMGAHPSGNEGLGGTGESPGMGHGQQGNEPAGQSGRPQEGQEPPGGAAGAPVSPGGKMPYQEFRDTILNDYLNVQSSAFDFNYTSDLSAKERAKAVADIQAGKNSAPARKLEAELKAMHDSGMVAINRGRGNHAVSTEVPIHEWFGLSNDERVAANKIDERTANLIAEEGITAQNIDNLKHLFNGFPYDETDFQVIKRHLSSEGQSNVSAETGAESSQGTSTAPAPSPDQTIEPPGDGGGTPINPDEWPFREEPFDIPVGIKKVIVESVRTQWNLPEVEFPKLGSDDEVLQRGKTAVDRGLMNPREIAQRVVDHNGIYTPEEGAAMQYYAHQLRKAESDFRQDKHEADDLLQKQPDNTAAFYAKVTAEQRLGQLDDEVELMTRANRTNSNNWGKLGNVMQIETDESFSPSRLRATIQDNYGGKIPEKVQEVLDKAIAERDAAIAEMKNAKEKVALQAMEKDAAKEKPTVAKSIKEKKDDLKKERIDLIEQLKKALKKDSGNLGANPLPIHTIEAVSKLALNYFKDGVLTVEAITNKIYGDLKDVVVGIDKNQIREAVVSYQPLAREQATEKALKQAAGKEVEMERLEGRRKTDAGAKAEMPEKKPKINFEKDTAYIKAHQRLVNAEFKIKREKMISYASQESRLQKTLGWANRLMRLSILSGVKVLEKLAAAATIGSAAQKPMEEVLNGIWGRVFPKIKQKADTDMGLNILAVGRYYSHFFNPVEFARDTKDIVTKGETRLGMELEKQHFDHIPLLDLPTDLHQVIKGPAKRAMFEYSLTKILADQQSKGVDINHPLVIESARQRAFARAKYEIFMEDNQVSRMFGRWEAKWRDQGKVGAAKSFLLHFAFPVSKVPTNIARRIGLSVAGVPMGLSKASEAYRTGIEHLSTDEANAIGRSLTKGSIGIGLWMAGFFAYKSLGGLYSKFDPNKQRKDEPLADEMKLLGQPISKPWQHAIPFEVMQLGATFRHIYEKTKTDTKSSPIAIAEATMGSAGAILEQIPVVETPINVVTATQDPYQAKRLGEDLKRRVQPQLLQDLGIIKKEDKKEKAGTGRRGGHKQ